MEKVTYLSDKFINYKGETQQFVLCAVSYMLDDTTKSLSVGVSFTHPKDTFNEEIGETIAYNKAIDKPCCYLETDNKGVINTALVTCVLTNIVEQIQKNPGKFIAGYNDAEKKYKQTCEASKTWSQMTEEDKSFITKLVKVTDSQIKHFRNIWRLIDGKR